MDLTMDDDQYRQEYKRMKRMYLNLKKQKQEQDFNNDIDQEQDFNNDINNQRGDDDMKKHEYKRMKKMYLDLKRQVGAPSNDKIDNDKIDNDKIDNCKIDNDKIVGTFKDSDYQKILDKLEKYCGNNMYENFKDKAKDFFAKFGATLSKFNIFDEHRTQDNKIKIDDKIADIKTWGKSQVQNYRHKMCDFVKQNIIPVIERDRNLQNKLVTYFGNTNVAGPVYIDKYLQFARENGLTNLAQVVNGYGQQSKIEYLNNQAAIAAKEPMTETNWPNGHCPSPTCMKTISKNGHTCISSCTKNKNFLGMDVSKCNTAPYKKYFMEWTWDHC